MVYSNNIILTNIILFLIIIKFSINIILIPFETYNPLLSNQKVILELIKNSKDIDIIDTLSKNLIYTNLSISKPSNKYQTFISLSSIEFYLKNLDMNDNTYPEEITGYYNYTYNDNYILKQFFKLNYYNSSLSNTYEYIADIKEDFYTQFSFDKGVYANETFFFQTKNIISEKAIIKPINLIFTYRQSVRFDHRPGVIGLGVGKNDFLSELKDSHEINNYEFSLKYSDIVGEKGEIIIGDPPHAYDEDNYKEKNLRCAKIIKDHYFTWSLLFHNIYIHNNNYIFEKNQIAKFRIEEFFILGTKEYFDIIQNIFFNKYIDEKICYMGKHRKLPYSDDFYHFICYIKDYNKREKFLKNFPSITFFQKEMYHNFTLDSKDLFTIFPDGNRLLFNIEFNNYNEWVFGKPFFKKYQLVFDMDSKLIKYYIKEDDEIEKNRIRDGKVLIIILLSIIIFIIGIFIWRILFCRNNRKIRANELEDNYSYIAKEIKDKNDMKNLTSKEQSLIDSENNISKLGY